MTATEPLEYRRQGGGASARGRGGVMGVVTETAGRPGGRDDRLLAWPAVRDITGLSRTTAWRMQKTGDFPLPVVVSPGRVCWWESELAAWKIARAPRRPAETHPFGSSAGRPTAPPLESADHTGDVTAPAHPRAAPQRLSRRRSAETPSAQISFDFGA